MSTIRARRRTLQLIAALLIALSTGCAALAPAPEPLDEPVDPAARAEQPEALQYPWCNAPPLPPASAEYREAMEALNDEFDIPLHRLRIAGLRMLPDAEALQPIELDPNRGMLAMSPDAAHAWILMQAAARADGVDLVPLSTYRSPQYQAGIIRNRIARGQAMDEILRTSLPPGFSEHHTGDAIDIGTPSFPGLGAGFAETEAYAWLQENAAAHCFELSYPEDNPYGLAFEPWHWRFVRRPAE